LNLSPIACKLTACVCFDEKAKLGCSHPEVGPQDIRPAKPDDCAHFKPQLEVVVRENNRYFIRSVLNRKEIEFGKSKLESADESGAGIINAADQLQVRRQDVFFVQINIPNRFEKESITYKVVSNRKLVVFYQDERPRFPIKLFELEKTGAREALAKSLDVKREKIDTIAAEILSTVHQEVEQNNGETQETNGQVFEEKPSEELKARAEQILNNEDPADYIVKVAAKIHYGDENKIRILWYDGITGVSPSLRQVLDTMIVGTAGVGKSNLVETVLLLFPDEFVIVLKECSPKAIYYAVKSGIELNGVIIYFDDVPDNPETVKVLKDLASNNIISPRLWSVSTERELLDVTVEGHIVIFASAVESLSDKADQFLRRYLILNPDENPDINEKVMEKIKRDIRFGQQGTTWLPKEDLKIAKEIVRQIKACEDSVTIPFDFEFPTSVVTERTNLKQFAALLCAITKTRFAQRVSIDGNLLAQPEDFDEAVRLWNTRQPEKVDVVTLKVLKLLGDEEPQEMKVDKNESVWDPSPRTSTTLAKELKLGPRRVNEKLNHLYDQGFADRKAVGGRGNPYAYWRSTGKINPTTQAFPETPKSQAAIRLKAPKTSSDDYYGESGLAGKEPELVRIYMERMDKYLEKHPLSTLSTEPVSAVIIEEKTEPKTGSNPKKKPSLLGVQKTLERTSPAENEENSGVQNSPPPKSPEIINEEIKLEKESIQEKSPNDLGDGTKPESEKAVMVSVRDWCKGEQSKSGTSEISLISLQSFIEKTLKVAKSSAVVQKAFDTGIITHHPKQQAGLAVVV
jgi:hypothetical protein